MSEVLIVDSWPVLEWLRGRDPGRARFLEALEAAVKGETVLQMSRINRGEVWYQVSRRWGLEAYPFYRSHIELLPIEIISTDDELVDEAADLKARFSISYADCFASALAIRTGAAILTGDPDFLKLERVGVLQVRWIGA